MSMEVKSVETPARLRAVLSAWLVFLTMLFGSVVFSAFESLVADQSEAMVIGHERLAADAWSNEPQWGPPVATRPR